MRTLLSSFCQLGLGVVLRHHSLSSYIYVPKDDILRAEIIRLYYDTLVGEHRGQ